MKSLHLTTRILLATGLTLSAASVLAEGEVKTGEVTTMEKLQTKVYELLDKDMTSIKFASGSTKLSDADLTTIRSFVTAAKNQGKLEKIIVASWSDEEMPRGDHKLTDKQRNLAKDRNHAVKQALKEAGAGDVEAFSMAEHASWITKIFNTEDAKLKGEGKTKDAEDRLITQIGQRLRDKGGPGTSVIVAKYDTSAAAH